MRFAYPIEIDEAADGITVAFPDVPEAITAGVTRAEAIERAADTLVSALSFYVEEGEPLPRPSPAKGRPMISVTALEAAKLALHDAMTEAGLSKVELARRMGKDERAIRRLLDPLHRSHIGEVETALRGLGKRVEVSVMQAA
ncbi:type II toxin-antitoxin system HicB family antitoxin [Acidiphilium sp.]|uniref:type II toxin-antitoxin system HicB family antitoxin n=1 Tax=Acidiphilium sp. TaxID=527 RepID=UPI003D075726